MTVHGLTPQERFWAKVHKTDACWLWTANKNRDGYGVFAAGTDKPKFAHRLSYEWAVGEIPAGMFVCHHCDTPACVNPAHLFVGTNSDNMKDAYRKGRLTLPVGQRLTDAQRAKGSAALTKTHCKRGHALVEGNLYWTTERGRPSRRCRACILAFRKRVRSKQ